MVALESLSIEETAILLRNLKIPDAVVTEAIKNDVDGEILSSVLDDKELESIGIVLPPPRARLLFSRITDLKARGGVDAQLLKSKITPAASEKEISSSSTNQGVAPNAAAPNESSPTSNLNLVDLDPKSPPGIAAALQRSVASLSSGSGPALPPVLASVEEALQAVVDFIGQDAEKLKAIGATPDVISDVVKALQLVGSSSPSIVTNANKPACLKALAALAKLCRFGQARKTHCEPNVAALGTAGACEAVVSTLKLYQNDSDISTEVGNESIL
jgi:hypothetical protein